MNIADQNVLINQLIKEDRQATVADFIDVREEIMRIHAATKDQRGILEAHGEKKYELTQQHKYGN